MREEALRYFVEAAGNSAAYAYQKSVNIFDPTEMVVDIIEKDLSKLVGDEKMQEAYKASFSLVFQACKLDMPKAIAGLIK